jgi:hypothetical protein
MLSETEKWQAEVSAESSRLIKQGMSPWAAAMQASKNVEQRRKLMKKCSICGKWVDSFNGVTQYDDNTPVFICDCCFLQTESGQELLANVTAAQPALVLDAPQAAIESDKSGAAHQ